MTINQEPAEAVTLVGWLRGSTGLRPVAKKAPWIVCGLLLQAAGIAMVLAWAYRKYKNDAVEGAALRTTFKLIWMETLHSSAGIAILAGTAVLFAAGGVLLARPYVRSLPMLLIGVPVAALAGLAVLGALALVVAVLVFLAWAGADSWSSSSSSRTGAAKSAAAKKAKEQVSAE